MRGRPSDARATPPRRALGPLALWTALLLVGFGLVEGFAPLEAARIELLRRDLGGGALRGVAGLGAYLLGLLSLAVLYGHASRIVRAAALAGTAVALGTQLVFTAVGGRGFGLHEATLALEERHFLGAALEAFGGEALRAVAIAGVAVALLAWLVPRRLRLRGVAWLALPVLAVALQALLVERTPVRASFAPLPYRVPLLVAFAARHRLPVYGPREPPALAPAAPPLADHLVVVVDESIRGDLLSLNGGPVPTTPFLESLGPRVLGYGVASAVSNLSSTANLLLQSGLRPDQVPDPGHRSLRSPSVFDYARAAGMRTFLIDAQLDDHRPSNWLTGYDLARLDGHLLVRRLAAGAREWELDGYVVALLAERIAAHPRTFTWVLKQGAHFPYDDKYPPGAGLPGVDGPAGVERTMARYLSAVRHAVDGFWRQVVERLDGRSVLVIYTSDHGQSLREALAGGGRLRASPHGTVEDPPATEAWVPLWLVGLDAGVEAALRARYDAALRDRASAWEVFPTILEAAGYDREAVRDLYHHSLFDADADRRRRVFWAGGLFGRDPGALHAVPTPTPAAPAVWATAIRTAPATPERP